MLRLSALLVSIAAWLSALAAGGQTIPAGMYDAPPLVVGDNQSIGSNTTLNVSDGGIVGNYFDAGALNRSSTNIEVNITGGTVGQYFEPYSGSTINISGGNIGWYMQAYNGSVINLTGGYVGSYFYVYYGSELNIDGGSTGKVIQYGGEITLTSGTLGAYSDIWGGVLNIDGGVTGYSTSVGSGGVINITAGELGWRTRALNDGTINLYNGRIDNEFSAYNDSIVNIFGGIVGPDFYASGGSEINLSGGVFEGRFESRLGSAVKITGNDFRVDGAPLAGLSTPGASLQYNIPAGAVLSGTFANGTPFVFSALDSDSIADGSLTLQTVALPTGPSVINAPAESIPQGVRAGQMLNVDAGGVVPANFPAGWGSAVNVNGGEVRVNFQAAGAVVNVSAGSVGNAFDMFHGSTLNVSGGTLGTDGRLLGAAIQMTGGVVGASLKASQNSTLQFSGGAIGDRLKLDASSHATLVGGDFRLDGVPIAGLNQPGDTAPLELPNTVVLSGILADGTPFAVTTQDGDTLPAGVLTLQQSALPPIGPAILDAAVDDAGHGIRTGQTLAVGAGSQLPTHYNMAPGAQLNVSGGGAGQNLEAVAATINLSSGVIGPEFDAYQGTVLNMTGGQLGQNAWLDNGSRLVQSGGVSSYLTATRASAVQVSGGSAGSITANQRSQVTLSGGEMQQLTLSESQGAVSGGVMTGQLTLGATSSLQWTGGRVAAVVASSSTAAVTIEGAEFYLDGVAVEGLNSPGDQVLLQVPSGAVLSGVLADGTTMALGNQLRNNDRLPSDQVTLRYSAPPAPDAAIIQVPGDPPPTSLRAGQTLRVEQGGVVGNHLTAGNGSRVEVAAGGSIGDNFEVVDAKVLVSGGAIGQRLDLFAGATLTMLGGSIGMGGHANGVQILGGTLDLFGGDVVSALTVENGGTLNVFGYDMTLAGVPITGLSPGETLTIAQRDGATLAGKLADGTPFDFRLQQSTSRSFDIFSLNSTVTVTLAEPAPLPGNFNNDGVVDGGDFLAWQRGETLFPLSEFELATWRANYGTTLNQPAPSASVPEPATCPGIVIIGIAVSMMRRRKQSTAQPQDDGAL